ncbi:hypothetical protein B0H17DRAFT_1268383 [Mycena rosella]|uniref:Uncharacterized protein n=1 Tax=Mycena rosella TaxID=1033263 RepID=A0AAD7G0G2_MYCRO|nr:hypothetical protein B0H17DRAFT_1268383 [Mycena rosella]
MYILERGKQNRIPQEAAYGQRRRMKKGHYRPMTHLSVVRLLAATTVRDLLGFDLKNPKSDRGSPKDWGFRQVFGLFMLDFREKRPFPGELWKYGYDGGLSAGVRRTQDSFRGFVGAIRLSGSLDTLAAAKPSTCKAHFLTAPKEYLGTFDPKNIGQFSSMCILLKTIPARYGYWRYPGKGSREMFEGKAQRKRRKGRPEGKARRKGSKERLEGTLSAVRQTVRRSPVSAISPILP